MQVDCFGELFVIEGLYCMSHLNIQHFLSGGSQLQICSILLFNIPIDVSTGTRHTQEIPVEKKGQTRGRRGGVEVSVNPLCTSVDTSI